MFNTFKYVTLSLARDKGIMIWSLVFPIVLATCFIFMFEGLNEAGSIDPVPTVVVQDANYENADVFKAFMDGISGKESDVASYNNESGEPLASVTYATTIDEAKELLWESESTDNPFVGYILVDAEGMPQLYARSVSSMTGIEEVNREILLMALDTFKAKSAMFTDLMEDNPYALSNTQVLQSIFDSGDATERITITLNAPKESVRYYFALLGMAALFGAQAGLIAVLRLLPNMGPLGARRELGGISHASSLAGTILASWTVSTICLLVAYVYMRLVANVDFAGHDGECVLAIIVSSLMATSLGAFLGSLPKIPFGAKTGILTTVVCVAALFAGLYGQPTMELADSVAKSFPVSQYINPAVQISQSFYSIMYYDTAGPYLGHIAILLIMTAVLFILSANFLRKQRYASL